VGYIVRSFTLTTNSSHSPTKLSQPHKLTTYTLQNMISVQSACRTRSSYLLICSNPSSTICIFLNTNHQLLFKICITLPVKSTPFFIPSTSFCSISYWFTSSCAYHLISRHLRSHHLSLPQSFTPDLKLISFTNPFLQSLPVSFWSAFMDIEFVLN